MSQTITIEIGDELPIREHEAEQIASLIYTIANTEEGITRLHLEIESEAVLNITPPTGAELFGSRIEETSKAVDDEDLEVVENEAAEEMLEQEDEVETITLNPETRRWTLASILYHSDDPLTSGEITAISEGNEWEMSQSAASAQLYQMVEEGLADRNGTPYAYELTEIGEKRLAQRSSESSTPIEPNPFDD